MSKLRWGRILLLVPVAAMVAILAFQLTRDVVSDTLVVEAHDKPLETEATSTSVDMIAVGDMMLDRHVRKMINLHGSDFIFSCIDPLFQKADFVLGNLEGPITNNPSVSLGSVVSTPENFTFTFAPETAKMLSDHNIKVVNIGNNHIDNFGTSGIADTHQYLTAAGVSYFGGLAGNSPVYRMNQNGIDLSFVNYNEFGGESLAQVSETIAQEHAMKRKVIVYTHWGDEYVSPPERVKEAAREFVRKGADLIIGSHPHVVQASEIIGSTPVYYSLGNFIFDQYWESAVSHGLILQIHITKDSISVEEQAVEINRDGRTCPVPAP